MRKGIVIELTSLLDVILIIFFAMIVTDAKRAENAQSTTQTVMEASAALQLALDDALDENARLEQANAKLENAQLSGTLLDENSFVLTLSVTREDNGAREVRVSTPDGAETRVALSDKTRDEAYNAVRNAVNAALVPYEGDIRFIAFIYDRYDIYESDYALVSSVLVWERANNGVYTAERDTAE